MSQLVVHALLHLGICHESWLEASSISLDVGMDIYSSSEDGTRLQKPKQNLLQSKMLSLIMLGSSMKIHHADPYRPYKVVDALVKVFKSLDTCFAHEDKCFDGEVLCPWLRKQMECVRQKYVYFILKVKRRLLILYIVLLSMNTVYHLLRVSAS